MEKYITQLLELLKEAEQNRPAPSYIELPEDMEVLRDIIELEKSLEEDEYTLENIFGVPQYYLPPEDRLTDEQVQQLKEGIIELWRVFHYEADFRRGEFNERKQYTMLVGKWKDHVPVFRGTNGTWHFEMYNYEDYWDEDQMRYLTDEEVEAKFREDMERYKNFDPDSDETPF